MLDEMRMRTACFARAPQRYTSRLSKYLLLTFQENTPVRKNRNQLLMGFRRFVSFGGLLPFGQRLCRSGLQRRGLIGGGLLQYLRTLCTIGNAQSEEGLRLIPKDEVLLRLRDKLIATHASRSREVRLAETGGALGFEHLLALLEAFGGRLFDFRDQARLRTAFEGANEHGFQLYSRRL